jgi:hypothetical protein
MVLLVAHQICAIEENLIRAKLPKPSNNAQITVVNAKQPIDDFLSNANRFLEKAQQAKIDPIEERERQLVSEVKRTGDAPLEKLTFEQICSVLWNVFQQSHFDASLCPCLRRVDVRQDSRQSVVA